MIHARSARRSEKFLRILRKPLRTTLRAEIVSLTAVLDLVSDLGGIHRHPANRVFGFWRPGQNGQARAGRLRVYRQIGHVAILDDFWLHPNSSGLRLPAGILSCGHKDPERVAPCLPERLLAPTERLCALMRW